MREFLFRGKSIDNGEWVKGSLHQQNGKAWIICETETVCNDNENTDFYAIEWYEVIPETVGQFTGLKDKNGVKIFEGDKVKCEGYFLAGGSIISIVEFDSNECLYAVDNYPFQYFLSNTIEPERMEIRIEVIKDMVEEE